MNFGLGLVLSFTDNATAGIQSAVNSLNQLTSTAESASSSLSQIASLSAFSAIATNVGNSMTRAGSAILSTFSQAISKVNETGQTLMFAESKFDKLYEGSGKTGKDVLADIQEYAKQSIFEFENLLPVVSMLKANGIEAFDAITSSSGQSSQTLMDYAADLAAFNPQMRNAYGTGIQAAMGALNEYIAEGNKKSLKTGASLDITAILGEDKGETIEERSRQVADLLEQLNMVGMVSNLAGTPMQRLSNMSDVLFQLIGKIANSGVYQKFTDIITTISEWVFSIPDEELDAIATTVGEALVTLMKPIEALANGLVKLADGFKNLVSNNPMLAKLATISVALAGALLVVGGVALKFAGSIGYLTLMISQFGKSFSLIKTAMMTGAKQILGALVPLTLALGLMYIVWKNDLFGIRTSVTQFVQNVVNSFQTAKKAVGGSLADIQNVLKQYDSSHSFFDGLTLALTRVMVLAKALSEGWNDFTLSEDTYYLAKELGILPLIEAIFDLKYRFDNFKEGFIEGWTHISDAVKSAWEKVTQAVDGTIFEGLLDSVTKFVQALGDNDAESWKTLGFAVGEVTASLVGGLVIVKLLTGAFKVLKTVISPVIKTVGLLFTGIKNVSILLKGGLLTGTGFVTNLANAFALAAGGAGTLHEALVATFGGVATTIAGVVAVVGGAILAVVNFFDMLKEGFSWLKEILMVVGIALVAVGAIILGAPALIAGIIAGIVALVATAVVVIKEHWEEIKTFFSNLLDSIATFFVNLWEDIKTGASNAVQAVSDFFSGVAEWFNTNVITPIVDFFTGLWEGIKEIWDGICNVVTTIVTNIQTKISTAWNTITTVTSSIWNAISSFFSSIWNTISTTVSTVVNAISAVISSVWNSISSTISSILNGISSTVSSIWNGIKSTVSGVVNSISSTVSSGFNAMKSTVTTIANGISSAVSTAFNAVKNTISNVINGAKTIVSNGLNAIKGFFNGLSLKFPNIKLPHFSITGSFSLSPPSVPHLSIDWYKQGGVFNKPSVIGVGEAGTEAVMPLENNTEWIGVLANMISSKMDSSSSMTPTNNSSVSNYDGSQENSYMTSTNNSTTNSTNSTDNSITFASGAIQITAQNSSDAEAEKLAKKIMEYIKRQQELNKMLAYN